MSVSRFNIQVSTCVDCVSRLSQTPHCCYSDPIYDCSQLMGVWFLSYGANSAELSKRRKQMAKSPNHYCGVTALVG